MNGRTDFIRGYWWVGLAICWWLSCSSYSDAAEVCTDKVEFTRFLQVSKITQDKLKVYGQKDATQVKLIAELKAHIADQDTQLAAGEKYKNAAEPLLAEYASQLEESITRTEALQKRTQELEKAEKDHEYSVWMERGKGFAVGVGLGVLYFIVK